jgi:hypothetical protein
VRNRLWVTAALIVCSVSLRVFAKSQEPTRQLAFEMKVYLDKYWCSSETKVSLTGPAEATLARITVKWPRYLNARQRSFSLQIAKFAALGHPEVTLARVELLGLPTLPAGNFCQSVEDQLESQWSSTLQSKGQAELDRSMGKGSALVLVDVYTHRGALIIYNPPVKDDARIARIDVCVFSRCRPRLVTLEAMKRTLTLDSRRDQIRTVWLQTEERIEQRHQPTSSWKPSASLPAPL